MFVYIFIYLFIYWASEASPTLASQREIFYVCIYIYLYVLVRSSGGAWLSSFIYNYVLVRSPRAHAHMPRAQCTIQ